jgi:hypothetical protein
MKTILILACLTALAASPVVAAEPPSKPANVEQRLRETDLAIALSQYEKVQMAAFEARLQLSLAGVKTDLPEMEVKQQRETMERRIKVLEDLAANLRERILRMGREHPVEKVK